MSDQVLISPTYGASPPPRRSRGRPKARGKARPRWGKGGVEKVQLIHPECIYPYAEELVVVDLFAGAGGTSTGAARAIHELGLGEIGRDIRLIAINHDEKAIATHALNHPAAEHYQDDVEKIDPFTLLKGTRLLLLVASPPCTHFSTARGGKPRDEQMRAKPHYVFAWVDAGRPLVVMLENVPDIVTWGPLDENGQPIPERKGEFFNEFLEGFTKRGYRWEWKLVNSADHGDPQSRLRWFLFAVRDDGEINWPRQTHSKNGEVPGTQRWVGADSILDLDERTQSIFARKKPLSVKTRARIARGFRAKGRFWEPLARAVEANSGPVPLRALLESAPPEEWPSFLVKQSGEGTAFREARLTLGGEAAFTLSQQGGGEARGVDEPTPTITTAGFIRLGGADLLVTSGGPERSAEGRATDEPLPTLLSREHFALGDARVLVGAGGPAWQGEPRDAQRPLPALTTDPHLAVATARFVLPPLGYHARGGEANRPREVDEPLQTLTAGRGGGHLAEAVITSLDRPETNRSLARDAKEPLPTITTSPRIGVSEPFLVPQFGERAGQEPRWHDAKDPLPAITSHGAGALVLAVLVTTYNGKGQTREANQPLGTQTTRDRHAVIIVRIDPETLDALLVDATLRMLTVRELAGGQSLPRWYRFVGTRRDAVKQIGNAVPVLTSCALLVAILGPRVQHRRRANSVPIHTPPLRGIDETAHAAS